MLTNIFAKTIRDQRRSLVWWAIGLIAMVAYVLAVYPVIQNNPEYDKLLANYPEALKAAFQLNDMTSAAGFLSSSLFSLMLPLILLCYSIANGANAIGGEEERRTLDLLLAHPISRTKVLIQKFLALCATLSLLGLISLLALVIGGLMVDLDIGFSRLAAGVVNSVLLALLFGSIALLIGAATGKRGLSIGVTAAIGIAAYLINTMGTQVESLREVRKGSPFYYYTGYNPLRNGFDATAILALLLPSLILIPLAITTFNRRDVAV